MNDPDILLAVKPVVEAFEQLSIPYFIDGSVASSVYGFARATMDVDVVADIVFGQVSPLAERLTDEYYVEERMIKAAISDVSPFNLIHLKTMMKIDVFIPERSPYHDSASARKLRDRLVPNDRDSIFYLSSPEDVILSKLRWYEAGGRVSERQWFDVLGVIKVQADSLDKAYLVHWSTTLGVHGPLEQAFQESGVDF